MRRAARVAAALLAAGRLWAGGEDNGLPGAFLSAGTGGKPMAMGGAYTGVADDINAIYWNPAGLAMYRSGQVLMQSSPLYLGGAVNYIAYSQPMYSLGSYGLAIIDSASGNVDRRDANNISVGSFKDREAAYLASYAYRFNDKSALGTTLKAAEHSIDGRSARGYGMDVGGLYQVREEKYKVGFMLRNLLAPRYGFAAESEKFPTSLRIGGAAYFWEDRLVTALDVEKTLGVAQSPRWHLGLQTYFFRNLYLRLGLNRTEYTGGMGVRWNTMELDYAAGYQTLGLMNRVSLKFFFGGFDVDVQAVPRVFSPVGLKSKTNFRIRAANRRRIVQWIISIRNGKNEVVRSFQGFSAPPKAVEWDGRDAKGQPADPGEYVYRLAVTDSKGHSETTQPRSLRLLAPTLFEIEAK